MHSTIFNVKTLLQILFSLFFVTCNYAQTDPIRIKATMEKVLAGDGFRNFEDSVKLNEVASFVFEEFVKTGAETSFEKFTVNGRSFKNVIGRIGSTDKPTIVIGAHYDVCGSTPGADDNASGLVGLIEAINQLKNYSGEYCLEFVAYTLEEPPYFGTKAMGSYIHASNLKATGRNVYGMVSLEMIGFFSDVEDSQQYPFGFMRWFYGKKADYIFIARQMTNGSFVKKFTKKYMGNNAIKTRKLGAPKSVTGIDFSDHRNYWEMGYDALMLTDTSFYRNKNYHKLSDTIDTIDFQRMAKVIDALVSTLCQF